MLLVFFCELPFIYIINRIVTQAITSKEREKELALLSNDVSLDYKLRDESIDRALACSSVKDDSYNRDSISSYKSDKLGESYKD